MQTELLKESLMLSNMSFFSVTSHDGVRLLHLRRAGFLLLLRHRRVYHQPLQPRHALLYLEGVIRDRIERERRLPNRWLADRSGRVFRHPAQHDTVSAGELKPIRCG